MQFTSRLFSFSMGRQNTDYFSRPLSTGNIFSDIINLFDNSDTVKEWVSFSDDELNVYKTTPELQMVIKKGGELLSNGIWKLKKNGEILDSHQVLDLLNNPNVLQGKSEFLQDLYIYRALYGNNFTYLNYALPSAEFPASIFNLNANQMMIDRSGYVYKQNKVEEIINGYVYYDILKSKILETFAPKDILQLRIANPADPVLGLSPIKSLYMPISNIRAARGYVYADYVKKGAHGFISSDNKDSAGALPLRDEDILAMERQENEQTHGSFEGQSSVKYLKKPAKWNAISSEIKSHLIHEEIELEFKKIIDAFGLNEALFSFLGKSTFSNQENGEKQAYQNGIIPIANELAYKISKRLDLNSKGLELSLDYSHISSLKPDEQKRSNTIQTQASAYQILRTQGIDDQEARQMVGFD